MSTKVTFRVVGIYCYLPYLDLPGIVPGTSTVKDVMTAIKAQNAAFDFEDAGGSVSKLSYNYSSNSTRPFNTFAVPANGPRDEEEVVGPTQALAWQYYRSVSGTFPGDPTLYEIKIANPTYSQPPYSTTPLNAMLQVPSNFTIFNYNLTWRLLQLQLTAEGARKRTQRLSRSF